MPFNRRLPAAGRFPAAGRAPLPAPPGRSRKFCNWFSDGRLPEPIFPESIFGRVPLPIEPPPGSAGRVPEFGKLGRAPDGLGEVLGRLGGEVGRLGDEVGRLIDGDRLAEPPPPRLPPAEPPRLPPAELPRLPPPPRARQSVPTEITSSTTPTLNHDRRIINLCKFDNGKDIINT
ncbi:hypothetical protein N9069_00035 [bacterium]|nr:hypothetical protein [bacterium]